MADVEEGGAKEDLPDGWLSPAEFDVVVLGTGLVESVLAAAVSRTGGKVLHLDGAACYGGQWRSVSLDELVNGEKSADESVNMSESVSQSHEDEVLDLRGREMDGVFNLETQLPMGGDGDGLDAGLMKKFVVDMTPKVSLANGSLISTLVVSNSHNYVEFKAIEKSYVWWGSGLRSVPASRADVFKDTSLTAKEKNRLYRFIKFCIEAESTDSATHGDDDTQTSMATPRMFVSEMERQDLSAMLRAVILYAIALVAGDETESAHLTLKEGRRRVREYAQSVGRFGGNHGALLYPLYGISELPQAFCRLAAVDGALYMLRNQVSKITHKDGKCTGIIQPSGQHILCSNIVASAGLIQSQSSDTSSQMTLSRCVAVTTVSIDGDREHVFAVFPPGSTAENTNTVQVIQLGPSCMACPEGYRIVHLITVGSGTDPRGDLGTTLSLLFPNSEDVKFAVYFNQRASEEGGNSSEMNLPSGVEICPRPDSTVNIDGAIVAAKDILQRVSPNADWFPSKERNGAHSGSDEDEDVACDNAMLASALKSIDGEVM